MRVPFLDLKAQYQTISDEIHEAIKQVLDRTAFASGPFVEKFEQEFAAFCQTEFAVGVNSGTTALWLALACLGVGRDDEVITVPNTFIATAEAISLCGAKPVFVDVDRERYTMDPSLLEAAISPRTKAIVPVHLYGQMTDMDPIVEIARSRGLPVVEDAAQAHGAEYKGKAAGSIGAAGCFSFYPGKNLGAYGEGGAIVTNDADLSEQMRRFRDHGQAEKYLHSLIGWNCRMDGIQGAVLSVKLRHLSEWNEARRNIAAGYRDRLDGVAGLTLPRESEDGTHVYHIYAVLADARREIMAALAEDGIASGMHYPVPVHLQEAYRFLGLEKGSYPVAEWCAERQISLPMFAEMTEQQVDDVAGGLRNIVEKTS